MICLTRNYGNTIWRHIDVWLKAPNGALFTTRCLKIKARKKPIMVRQLSKFAMI